MFVGSFNLDVLKTKSFVDQSMNCIACSRPIDLLSHILLLLLFVTPGTGRHLKRFLMTSYITWLQSAGRNTSIIIKLS